MSESLTYTREKSQTLSSRYEIIYDFNTEEDGRKLFRNIGFILSLLN